MSDIIIAGMFFDWFESPLYYNHEWGTVFDTKSVFSEGIPNCLYCGSHETIA